MKLVHVVPHIDKEAAGPSYSIPRLCQSLAACGNEVELTCLAARGEIDGVKLVLHPQWRVLKSLAVSSSLAWALKRSARVVDVIHNHSLWSMVNMVPGWVVPHHRAKLVTSPRGTLSAWALNRNKRRKSVLWLLQRRSLALADMLHATSENEYEEIRLQGFKAPVAIIPNGIDVPDIEAPTELAREEVRTLLFLSRIHPTKGLDKLLQAWADLEQKHLNWRLVIAGRGNPEHVEYVTKLAATLGVNRVDFPGPLYGEFKTAAYQNADLFVLPTHSENFGVVIAEALAHGCPVVVSRGAPWAGIEAEGCGWWIENTVPNLVAALDAAMALPTSQLRAMGLRGRAWMERDFSWTAIGQKMNAAYLWLVAKGERPDFVRLD